MKSVQIKKKPLIILAVILLLALAALVFLKGYKSAKQRYEEEISKLQDEVDRLSDPVAVYEVASQEIDISVIRAQVQDIGELATVEYFYTDAGKYESAKQLWGKDVIFTNKSFIAKWDGIIKAGIEVDKISVELDKENKKIIVKIPNARILSHEIVEDSFETLDERNGLFNPIEVDDIRNFDAMSKEAMENRAIENGILDKAQGNAKSIILKLLENDSLKEAGYRIEIEVVESDEK